VNIQMHSINPIMVPLADGSVLPCDQFDPAVHVAADESFGALIAAGEVSRLQEGTPNYLKKWTPFIPALTNLVNAFSALQASMDKGPSVPIGELRANLQAYGDADAALKGALNRWNWSL